MSANNWINSPNISKIIEENLNYSKTSWLNNSIIENIISNNLNDGIPYPSKASTYAYGRMYDDYNVYYRDNDIYGNSGSGGYYDDYGDGYNADIYIESGGYDAYAEYNNYSDYNDYSDYDDYNNYNNYYNYSKTNVYFYWTKNNDGTTKMTGSETGLMSPWAMTIQVNYLIDLINTYANKNISKVSQGSPLTASKYNEIASALGVANLTAGTKITVQHFYILQTSFNSKGYYRTG